MRTTWTKWNLDDMQDAAEAHGHVELDALAVPERDLIATLPYYDAFAEYRDHVVGCTVCRDTQDDCPEGAELRRIARVGLEEQARIALNN
jgi:hypothetical protein